MGTLPIDREVRALRAGFRRPCYDRGLLNPNWRQGAKKLTYIKIVVPI
jgi:hypothetical protein